MTKRTIVLVTAGIALAVFLLGAAFYTRPAVNLAEGTGASGESILYRTHSPILGPPDAKVTVTEFFDPACETCREFFPVVEEIIADHQGKVRFVLRYATFHPGSDEVVRILEAARRQNKFESVLTVLLQKQGEWAAHGSPNIPRAWEIAGETGLEIAKAKQDAYLPEVDRIVKAADVSKTPTFFVNGKPLQSFGMQQLYDMVKEEVDR